MIKIVSKLKNLLPLQISTWRYTCNVRHVICGVFQEEPSTIPALLLTGHIVQEPLVILEY